MYVYHKAAFTFEVSFFTLTYETMNVIQLYTQLDEHSWKDWLP